MTDQEKQKLNEKIAKWVGFKFKVFRNDAKLWTEFPDGNYVDTEHELDAMPDFAIDLNACFKWFPMRISTFGVRSVSPLAGGYVGHAIIQEKLFDHVDAEAAISLCLAVEKGIDGGAK